MQLKKEYCSNFFKINIKYSKLYFSKLSLLESKNYYFK